MPVVLILRRNEGPIVPQRFVYRMVVGLQQLGIDPNPALARFGLSADQVEELEQPLRLSFFYDFWQALVDTTGVVGLGLRLATQVRYQRMRTFGKVLASSTTLGDALLRATRFVRLANDWSELQLSVEGDRALLVHRPYYADLLHPEGAHYIIGTIGVIANQLAQRRLRAAEVRFTHPAPPDARFFKRFFGSPVRFGCPHDGYVFETAHLHLPVVGGDHSHIGVLEEEAGQLLDEVPRTGEFSRRVLELIDLELRGGNPSAERIAKKLKMHPKTLSRRLRAEGTSHQVLLDRLRYERAERYLRDSRFAIAEVAFLLGYSDTSSFNKAFKRWTGTAPQHYRQRSAT